MKLSDLTDYLALRRLVKNPAEVVLFRKNRNVERELVVQMRNQPPLYLRGGREDFHMFHRIFLRDEYRLATLPAGRFGCVVDLGGNVGMFAARVAPQADRVVSYEPLPVNLERYSKNTKGLENITAVPAAIAGQSGTLKIYAPRMEKMSGAFSAHANPEQFDEDMSWEVPAVTLAELFDAHDIVRCNLLKMDIEGSEYDVLPATDDKTFERIDRIHGEYHNVEPETASNRLEALEALLRSHGYAVDVVRHRHKPNHGMFYARRT
ncbi:MAG: FkbM family methyltransferase [Planctomycetota bacterium]